MYSSQRKTIL